MVSAPRCKVCRALEGRRYSKKVTLESALEGKRMKKGSELIDQSSIKCKRYCLLLLPPKWKENTLSLKTAMHGRAEA